MGLRSWPTPVLSACHNDLERSDTIYRLYKISAEVVAIELYNALVIRVWINPWTLLQPHATMNYLFCGDEANDEDADD